MQGAYYLDGYRIKKDSIKNGDPCALLADFLGGSGVITLVGGETQDYTVENKEGATTVAR